MNTFPRKVRNYTILFVFVAIGLVFSLVHTLNISAQNQISAQSLEVSPPSQEIKADPGQTVVIKSKVRNKSNQTIPVNVRVEDFTAQGEEGQIALVDGGLYSLSKWTSVSPASFELKPGAEQEITGQIVIPSAKVAGGYYGSFVYSVMGEKLPNTATVGQEIASLFLLRVSGPVSEKIYLDALQVPSFSEFGPVPFALKFTNSGNVHSKVYGLINITDMFGTKVTDIVVNGTNIFPGASRLVKATFNERFLFGKYTATAIIYYGAANETLTAVSHFTVMPVRIVALLLVVVILLFIARRRLRKAMKALFG